MQAGSATKWSDRIFVIVDLLMFGLNIFFPHFHIGITRNSAITESILIYCMNGYAGRVIPNFLASTMVIRCLMILQRA